MQATHLRKIWYWSNVAHIVSGRFSKLFMTLKY